MGSPVEALTEAVDALAGVNLDSLGDDDLDAELVAVVRLRHRLDAEIARRTARWEARGVWLSDGSRAAWARLSRTAAVSPGNARAIIGRATALTAMPLTGQALAAGEIGVDHVDLLATAAGEGRHQLFVRDEAVLVTPCEELTYRQATKVIQYWIQRADAALDRDGTPPPKPGTLRISTGFDGTVNGDFSLDPIGGATVAEALRRIEAELYHRDQREGVVRTNSERLAAALVELAVRAHTAPAGGRRPEPLICILAGETTIEHLCELATGTVIGPHQVAPHLARCDVQTFIFDGADHVIAASRQRTYRGMLRRAIQVRDRHCQHPAGVTPRSPTATSTTEPPTPPVGSPTRAPATSNANPTTGAPTSTTANPPKPSPTPANAAASNTSPANDYKPPPPTTPNDHHPPSTALIA